jgi:hypothetical protein
MAQMGRVIIQPLSWILWRKLVQSGLWIMLAPETQESENGLRHQPLNQQ